MFSPENITRGLYAIISGADDEDVIAGREREEAEAQAKHDKAMDDLLQKAVDNDPVLNVFSPASGARASINCRAHREQVEATKKAGNITKGPSTSASKSAASALSRPLRPSAATRPTAATAQKAKKPAPHVLPVRKNPVTGGLATGNTPGQRTTSGNIAASRTTLGYAQGRAVSSNLRRPLQDVVQGARPQSSSRSTSTGELKKAAQVPNQPKDNSSDRGRAHQKENRSPISRAAPTASSADVDSELESWLRDNETGFDFGRNRDERNDGEGLVGDLPTLDETLREEAMEEFRFELPGGE